MSEVADLRIATKRVYHDNNKPYGESETITVYIYNAGPNRAKTPRVRVGFGYSMDYSAVITTLRQAQVWRKPSEAIKNGTLTWTTLSNPTSLVQGWDIVTTLSDVQAGTLMELNLSFPMLHETSYKDYLLKASVVSPTLDLRLHNNFTAYIITPNHHHDGPDYWNTPGDLASLDFEGLTSALPISRADLRIASTRATYNNNLPHGQSETLTFLVFNDGPTIATQPVLTAGYTTSMDYNNVSCSCEQVWVPEGANPSSDLDNYAWKSVDGVTWRTDGWNVICSLPNIPPTVLYRVKITFPMNHETTYKDYTATASISSQATEVNANSSSTTYVITPNHQNDNNAYWQTKGNIAQLDGPSLTPFANRAPLTGWLLDTPIIVSDSKGRAQIPLTELEGWISEKEKQIVSYNIRDKTLKPKVATKVEYGTSSDITVLSFSADGKTQLSYSAHPDTLLYLNPTKITAGQDEVRLAYWIPVRMLWVGAAVSGMSPGGGMTVAYVTNIQHVAEGEYRSAEPQMVSQSHSYVVGTLGSGGVLTHNPKNGPGPANVPAMLAYAARIANNLVATTTPPPGLPNPPHGYTLRHRRPTDRAPPSAPAPPILPPDVPRRDEHGNWLIYLYEEDSPAAVENARFAVEEGGQPWRLTYDPAGAHARRSQSTGPHQSQRELLQLTTEELTGRSGTGQLDRDEYPPAIAAEGGRGAIVTYIEAGDNRRAGSLMGQQFTNYRMNPQPDGHAPLQSGDTFRFAIIHENMASVEYLGDDSVDASQLEQPPIE
ncbi:deoxyribonuclease nucA/NucB domain-containing protein [Pochonia chlamydosporia 170]|uniref:Deoxyribonuclease nucA/NucB domain-containing protein n=1 Tax=Pochonia chlamydosporia 170 TaxID=1380566 RepID=A0A179F0H4_METCM|nr:deoxyribonuclease nucA/NucB domain-containing protein [Pochonia chlamydosporia 170]OAQ58760.1 deoxyribonuclease nucA/NucB domain-containing protein [Pochonia chlamydosporia 170]